MFLDLCEKKESIINSLEMFSACICCCFQYMESVSSAYLENKEHALETEQLVTMTCKKHLNRWMKTESFPPLL